MIQAIAFDAYGTLFDVYSVAVQAERLFPGRGEALARLWRQKQIEYTQLRTMCSTYKPFWEVTQDALVFAARYLGLTLDFAAQNTLMGQYARLTPFEENSEVLQNLAARSMRMVILSNGNRDMLETVVGAAGWQGCFQHLLSADSVRRYKTAPEVYQLAPDVLGVTPRNILFVSSNAWDVCGASWFGFKTFWVNRAAVPMEELGVSPDGEGRNLRDLLSFVQQHATLQ